jgi:hypothetical protein
MAFPLSVQFSKKLKVSPTPENFKIASAYIQQYLSNSGADNISVLEYDVSYSTAFLKLRWGWDIYGPVDNGFFTLESMDDHIIIKYRIVMVYMLGFGIAAGLFFGFLSGLYKWGLFIFFWLWGVNFLITLFRHNDLLLNIRNGIEKHISNSAITGKQEL